MTAKGPRDELLNALQHNVEGALHRSATVSEDTAERLEERAERTGDPRLAARVDEMRTKAKRTHERADDISHQADT